MKIHRDVWPISAALVCYSASQSHGNRIRKRFWDCRSRTGARETFVCKFQSSGKFREEQTTKGAAVLIHFRLISGSKNLKKVEAVLFYRFRVILSKLSYTLTST